LKLILWNIKVTGYYNVVWVLKIANYIFYVTKKSNQPEDGS